MKTLRRAPKSALFIAILIAGCLSAVSARAERPTTRPNGGGKPDLAEVFKKLDTNNDGKLSKEEFAAFAQKMAEHRAQKTGAGGEGKAGGEAKSSQPHDGSKMFERLDTNKDGFLSLDEFKKIAELRHEGQSGQVSQSQPNGRRGQRGGSRQ